ncbi:phasin family protein [Candidatus Thiosymbion oneisti]|uniref:phasin family protein n=1 Tax=Candidatus Thiosymbion oneisti TaxID=589554 RepID=UPI000B7F9B4D|nr:phasin family protein [Candidatus Thiosymbion oneisti]
MATTPESLQDLGKSIMSMDITKGADRFLDALAKLKVPGVDMDALVASQRDNLEAMGKANQAVMEGVTGVGKWQMKILMQTLEEISKTGGSMTKIGSPKAVVGEQTDMAKRAFETAVTSMRELADILNTANQTATKVIVDRVPDSLDEVKEILKVTQ